MSLYYDIREFRKDARDYYEGDEIGLDFYVSNEEDAVCRAKTDLMDEYETWMSSLSTHETIDVISVNFGRNSEAEHLGKYCGWWLDVFYKYESE